MLTSKEIQDFLSRASPEEKAEFVRLQQALRAANAKALPFGPEWCSQPEVSDEGWHWDYPHQKLIFEKLAKLSSGEIKRLMIWLPPGHSKSELVTIRYAAYSIERDPKHRVIVGCHTDELAKFFGRKIKRIAEARNVLIKRESRSIQDWETEAGGGCKVVGVGTGIAGRRGRLIVIDDPIKSHEEANQSKQREVVWNWFANDIMTRAEPGGNSRVVLIMTRWHDDDLCGRLIQRMASGDEPYWEIVDLPAIAETQEERDMWYSAHGLPTGKPDLIGRKPGEPLCPAMFDLNYLLEQKNRSQGMFFPLFQQRPQAASGTIFTRDMLHRWQLVDGIYYLKTTTGEERRVSQSSCWRFQTIDVASSKKAEADWSVCATWDVSPTNDVMLVDMSRTQSEGPEVRRWLREKRMTFGAQFQVIEQNGVGLPQVQAMLEDGEPVRGVWTHQDKLSHARAVSYRMESGKVFIPESCPIVENALLAFPKGRGADIVDTFSRMDTQLSRNASATPEFYQRTHVSLDPLKFKAKLPLVCGWEAGDDTAVVAVQMADDGQIRVLAEYECNRKIPGEIVQGVEAYLLRVLGDDLDYRHYGNGDVIQKPEGHVYEELRRYMYTGSREIRGYNEDGSPDYKETPGPGWSLIPSIPDEKIRVQKLRDSLTRLIPGGRPALTIDPSCEAVIQALSGGASYSIDRSTGIAKKELDPGRYRTVLRALATAVASVTTVSVRVREDEDSRGMSLGPKARRH